MSDDPIRDLLAAVARATMDMRPGYLSAPLGHVEAHGGDLGAVRAWGEAHGGYVDNPPRPQSRAQGGGRWMAPATTADLRRFVFPAAALET